MRPSLCVVLGENVSVHGRILPVAVSTAVVRRLTPVAIAIACTAVLVEAQAARQAVPTHETSPARTFDIGGRVVASETGAAIANARVALTDAQLGNPVVLTADDGTFVLKVSQTPFNLIASKSGFAAREVTSTAGVVLDIRLQRSAAIAGRVVDELGAAVAAVRVVAERRSPTGTLSTRSEEE